MWFFSYRTYYISLLFGRQDKALQWLSFNMHVNNRNYLDGLKYQDLGPCANF